MPRNPIANFPLLTYEHCQEALAIVNTSITEAQRNIRELEHARAGIEGLMVAAQMQGGMVTTQEFLNKVVDIRLKLQPLLIGDMDYLTGLVMKTDEDIDDDFEKSFHPVTNKAADEA